MATVDMDVIKEIPGYKVILKAVLKSQIQQLVEQLASHTDEESVILTASVSDGTLSHLGSLSGKFFLEDHEDIKSQFLGFCLKRHHKQKQLEKDREDVLRSGEVTPPGYIMHHQGQRFASIRTPRMPSSRQPALHPVAMSRVSPGTHSPSFRHEPYPRTRPSRMPGIVPQSVMSPGQNQMTMKLPLEAKDDGQVIKIEQEDDEDSSNQDNAESCQKNPGEENSTYTPSPSQCLDSAQVNTEISNKDSDVSDSDTGVVHAEGLEPQSDHSNVVSNTSDQPGTSGSASQNRGDVVDTDLIVKLEAISESEMDLEITGMEPGRSVISQENWASIDMGFDPTGATGMQLDLQGPQQGYMQEPDYSNLVKRETKVITTLTESFPQTFYRCSLCDKEFSNYFLVKRHVRGHTGHRPYTCSLCGWAFSRQDNWRRHMSVVHKQ